MSESYIEKFLNFESLEALEASKGAQIVRDIIPKRDAVKVEHDKWLAEFHKADNLINEKRDELRQINRMKFFDYMKDFFKLRKKRRQLERDIVTIDNSITDIIQEMAVYYREMRELNNIIDDFIKELKMFGLTIEDIRAEYERMKAFFEKSGQVQASVSEKSATRASSAQKSESKKEESKISIFESQPQA